jgi:hypothetical protein
MVGNLCTIFGFLSLIIGICLDIFVMSSHSRLFGVFPKQSLAIGLIL